MRNSVLLKLDNESKYLTKKELIKGRVVTIFNDCNVCDTIEGEAILLKDEYKSSLPFIINDAYEGDIDCVTYKCARWTVQFISADKKGFTTSRWIRYLWRKSQFVTSQESSYEPRNEAKHDFSRLQKESKLRTNTSERRICKLSAG